MGVNAMAIPAALEPGPLVTRRRTVANVDSIGLVCKRSPKIRPKTARWFLAVVATRLLLDACLSARYPRCP